ncbi:hypothetical protein UlMin_039631 [Ulmus minor]
MARSKNSEDLSLCSKICLVSVYILTCLVFVAAVVYPFVHFIFLCIFLPQNIKFAAYEASLTQFNLTTTSTNTTLFYDLAFNISIRNPNKKAVGIYFYDIKAEARYNGRRFATAPVSLASTPFYLGHKNTTFVHPVFQGQHLVSANDYKKIIEKYNSEASTGTFSINVKIDLQVSIRYGKIKHFRYQTDVLEYVSN